MIHQGNCESASKVSAESSLSHRFCQGLRLPEAHNCYRNSPKRVLYTKFGEKTVVLVCFQLSFSVFLFYDEVVWWYMLHWYHIDAKHLFLFCACVYFVVALELIKRQSSVVAHPGETLMLWLSNMDESENKTGQNNSVEKKKGKCQRSQSNHAPCCQSVSKFILNNVCVVQS